MPTKAPKARKLQEIKRKKGEILLALQPRIEGLFGDVETFLETLGYTRDAFYKWTRKGSWPHMASEFERKVTELLRLTENPFAQIETDHAASLREAQQKLSQLWLAASPDTHREITRYLDQQLNSCDPRIQGRQRQGERMAVGD